MNVETCRVRLENKVKIHLSGKMVGNGTTCSPPSPREKKNVPWAYFFMLMLFRCISRTFRNSQRSYCGNYSGGRDLSKYTEPMRVVPSGFVPLKNVKQIFGYTLRAGDWPIVRTVNIKSR